MAEATMPGLQAVMNVCPNGVPATSRHSAATSDVSRYDTSPMAAGAVIRFTFIRLKRGTASSRKSGGLLQIAHERPVTGLAEAGHAVLHVGEEALPGLLAVVADVDAGSDLGRDGRGGGVL